jgi:hypothetical protein
MNGMVLLDQKDLLLVPEVGRANVRELYDSLLGKRRQALGNFSA